MNIDPTSLCVLLFNIASEHVNDFYYLKHVRPMPAFVTTKDNKHYLSINFDLTSFEEQVPYSRIQSEAQKLVKFFNEASHYKLKYSTAEHLLIKMARWLPILQIRLEVIGHDFCQGDPDAMNTFMNVWN